jgi:hypothetical protein
MFTIEIIEIIEREREREREREPGCYKISA